MQTRRALSKAKVLGGRELAVRASAGVTGMTGVDAGLCALSSPAVAFPPRVPPPRGSLLSQVYSSALGM